MSRILVVILRRSFVTSTRAAIPSRKKVPLNKEEVVEEYDKISKISHHSLIFRIGGEEKLTMVRYRGTNRGTELLQIADTLLDRASAFTR